jgi:predicted Na+-dependent transporter
MLPLGVGLSVHHVAPNIARRIVKPLGLVANILLMSVVVLVLAREYESIASIRPRGWLGMGLLLAATLGIGWVCGGPTRATRKSLAVTTGVRNAAVALVIVSGNSADTAAVTAVVAYGIASIFATLGFSFLLGAVPEPPEATRSNHRRLPANRNVTAENQSEVGNKPDLSRHPPCRP